MLLSRSDDFFFWNSERPVVRVFNHFKNQFLSLLKVYIMELRYHYALFDQPRMALLSEEYRIIVPVALFIVGQIFVITSTWALGITGTFLGDYFGILMDHRVEGYVQFNLFLWVKVFF